MIEIINHSSNPVQLTVNGVNHGPLITGQCHILSQCASLTVILQPVRASRTKGETVFLSVITAYEIFTLENARLFITRESLCFEENGYYECFRLSAENATVTNVSYNVAQRERIRKRLKRFRILKILFIEPFSGFVFDFLVEVVLSSGCGGILLTIAALIGLIIAASVYNLWGYVLGAVLALWLFYVIVELTSDKIFRWISKKSSLPSATSLTELDRWYDPKFISEYFSSPERVPYTGEIER